MLCVAVFAHVLMCVCISGSVCLSVRDLCEYLWHPVSACETLRICNCKFHGLSKPCARVDGFMILWVPAACEMLGKRGRKQRCCQTVSNGAQCRKATQMCIWWGGWESMGTILEYVLKLHLWGQQTHAHTHTHTRFIEPHAIPFLQPTGTQFT
jgi:hypothetical protein